MRNSVLFKYITLLLIVSTGVSQLQAQDSIKRTTVKPPAKKLVIKPYKTYTALPGTTAPPYKKPVYKKPLTSAAGAVPPGGVAAKPAYVKPVYIAADPSALNNKNLSDQYQYVLGKVYRYQQPIITALAKNFADTLNHARGELKALQTKLSAQTKITDSLKTELNSKAQTLTVSAAKIDTLSVFGLTVAKATYNLIMIGLVLVLTLALVVIVITTAKYRHEARYRVTLYEELDEEYKTYKAKANEKEKKLARELQTERNKLDELLGRS